MPLNQPSGGGGGGGSALPSGTAPNQVLALDDSLQPVWSDPEALSVSAYPTVVEQWAAVGDPTWTPSGRVEVGDLVVVAVSGTQSVSSFSGWTTHAAAAGYIGYYGGGIGIWSKVVTEADLATQHFVDLVDANVAWVVYYLRNAQVSTAQVGAAATSNGVNTANLPAMTATPSFPVLAIWGWTRLGSKPVESLPPQFTRQAAAQSGEGGLVAGFLTENHSAETVPVDNTQRMDYRVDYLTLSVP